MFSRQLDAANMQVQNRQSCFSRYPWKNYEECFLTHDLRNLRIASIYLIKSRYLNITYRHVLTFREITVNLYTQLYSSVAVEYA